MLASPPDAPDALAHARLVVLDNLTTRTVEHWNRILEGELFATSSRARWAVLLRRTFGFDALRCPRCEAPMRILATLTEAAAVERILAHLGVRTTPLPRGRARDPTGQTGFDFDVA